MTLYSLFHFLINSKPVAAIVILALPAVLVATIAEEVKLKIQSLKQEKHYFYAFTLWLVGVIALFGTMMAFYFIYYYLQQIHLN